VFEVEHFSRSQSSEIRNFISSLSGIIANKGASQIAINTDNWSDAGIGWRLSYSSRVLYLAASSQNLRLRRVRCILFNERHLVCLLSRGGGYNIPSQHHIIVVVPDISLLGY
jgi:hypothetical protein